jgi:chromosome segregation ATPase
VVHLEAEAKRRNAELESTKAQFAELEQEADIAAERLQTYEADIVTAQEAIDRMDIEIGQQKDTIAHLQGEVSRANEVAKRMEDALDAAETKMQSDDKQISQLKGQISSLERETDRLQDRISNLQNSSRSQISPPGPTEAEYQALEDELDAANREVARLNTLLNQSPARKAIDKAKDTKIEMLEREKEELMERVKALKSTVTEINTPSRLMNHSNVSPIHRQALLMSLRAPRTPGAPLKDVSKFHDYRITTNFWIAFLAEQHLPRPSNFASYSRNFPPATRTRSCQ